MDTIERAREQMTDLARGESAPVIKGIGPGGEAYSIEDLSGKVIYIDVWATWCSGCVKNIPAMYTLQEEFSEDPDLVFLFVSVDEDLDRWKAYISKLPAGLHMNAHNSGLYKDYMIGGIPHYMIIDASGDIYLSNAPGPDSREIKNILEELVKGAG